MYAAQYPALTGRVVDNAHILNAATQQSLVTKLTQLEDKSQIQLVVATVPSLDGQEIEPYANTLFRQWKLGINGKDNGLLLLVAPTERRVRIEVGYGLEGTITDAVSKIIIANSITPKFKTGDYNSGISAGVDDLIAAVSVEAGTWQPKKPNANPQNSAAGGIIGFLIIGFFILVVISLLRGGTFGQIVLMMLLSGGNSRSGSSGGFDGGGFSGGGGATIDLALHEASQSTQAHIICVLARHSDSYSLFPLMWASLLALLAPWPLIYFTDMDTPLVYLIQLGIFIVALAIFAQPAIRVRLAPLKLRRTKAHHAALEQFAMRHNNGHAAEPGLLIFVSHDERWARIMVSHAVSVAIPQAHWQKALDVLRASMRNGQIEQGFTQALSLCQQELAVKFPRDAANLPPRHDRIVLL
eukprot:gene2345-2382_t